LSPNWDNVNIFSDSFARFPDVGSQQLIFEMILIVYSTQYWANPKPLPGHLVNQLDVSMSFCKLLVCLMNGNIKKQNQCNILFFLSAHQIYSRI